MEQRKRAESKATADGKTPKGKGKGKVKKPSSGAHRELIPLFTVPSSPAQTREGQTQEGLNKSLRQGDNYFTPDTQSQIPAQSRGNQIQEGLDKSLRWDDNYFVPDTQSQVPAQSREPARSRKPAKSRQTQKPAQSRQTQEPAQSREPEGTQEPAESQEPIGSREPAEIPQPAESREPMESREQTGSGEPAVSRPTTSLQINQPIEPEMDPSVHGASESLQAIREDLFHSEQDSYTGSQKDFEGFLPDELEPTPRSVIVSQPSTTASKHKKRHKKRSHRKKRKHYSSSSDSSESDSDDEGRRSKKSRKSRGSLETLDILEQLKALVSQSLTSTREPPIPREDDSQPGPSRQQSASQPSPTVRSPETRLDRSIEEPGPSGEYVDTGEDLLSEAEASEEDLDEPLLGTEITQEAFEKSVEVLRRLLGFETPVVQPDPNVRQSKLSLNRTEQVASPTMPVDVECSQRFLRIAEAKHWIAFQNKQYRTFQLEDKSWHEICSLPRIPEEAKERRSEPQERCQGHLTGRIFHSN